jgi:transposase
MGTPRKKYPALFKIKVAAEAISGELSLAQLSAKYGVHPSLISRWKNIARQEMVACFEKSGSGAGKRADPELMRLIMRSAELDTEIDFLKEKLEEVASRSKNP